MFNLQTSQTFPIDDLTLRKAVTKAFQALRRGEAPTIFSEDTGIGTGIMFEKGELLVFHREHGSTTGDFPEFELEEEEQMDIVAFEQQQTPFLTIAAERGRGKINAENALSRAQIKAVARTIRSFGRRVKEDFIGVNE